MKTKVTLLGLLAMTGLVGAQSITSYTNGTLSAIPDGNLVGITEAFNVSGITGDISDVQLTLDITGGFNGDLYAYLVGPQGQLAILLNRVGVTAGNVFGYGDSGMNITLDGQGTSNIHDYQSTLGWSLNGTLWAADGRAVDPQSAGMVFDSATTTANLGVFQNTDPNGQWTLFIADVSGGGGTPLLDSIILNIMTVPEPQTWTLVGLGALVLFWRKSTLSRSLKLSNGCGLSGDQLAKSKSEQSAK